MSRQELDTLPLSLRRAMKPATTPLLWGIIVLLMAISLLLHARGLTALPMLGEEAHAIRLANALRGFGVNTHWIQALGVNSPLHLWLLRLAPASSDPLRAARWLSLLCGALMLPLGFLTWLHLGRLLRESSTDTAAPSPSTLGLIAAIFLLLSPYLSITQRAATADALFLLESLAIAWLSLRLGTGLLDGASLKSLCLRALPLGLALGAALLTVRLRAWPLLALPFAALLAAHWRTKDLAAKRTLRPALTALALAFILALACWLPWQIARAAVSPPPAAAMAQNLHQPPASSALPGQIIANLKLFFIPTDLIATDSDNLGNQRVVYHTMLDNGWYFVYCSPPVFILIALAFPWLLSRRERGVFLFLGAWVAATIGPLLFALPEPLSRFGAPGVIPLLLAASYMLIDMMSAILSSSRLIVIRWASCLLLAGAALAWPAAISYRNTRPTTADGRPESAVSSDVSHAAASASSAKATQSALAFLQRVVFGVPNAPKPNPAQPLQPIIVLLPPYPANPADSVWLALHRPGLQPAFNVFDLADMKDLPALGSAIYTVCDDRYTPASARRIEASPGTRVYLVMPDPVLTPGGLIRADDLVADRGELVGVFANWNDAHGVQQNDYVRVYLLK